MGSNEGEEHRHLNETNIFAQPEPTPLTEAQKLYQVVQQRPDLADTKRIVNPFAALENGRPIVSYTLLAIIVLIFGVMTAAGGSTVPTVLIDFGAMFGPAILDGQLWRLFSAMFLHIGVTHLAFNGFALYSIGRDVERIFGHSRFIALYLLSGLFGSLATFAVRGVDEFSAGASGALFGMVGMSFAFFFFHRKRLGKQGKAQMKQLLQLVAVNLVIGISLPGINNLAHMGGLFGGLFLGYFMAPRHHIALDDFKQEAYLVDQTTLAKRWWVIVIGFLIWAAGLWLALDFHNAPFLPTNFL